MDGKLPPATGGVLAMMRWRLDLLELAVTSALEGDPECPRLAEAADALRGFRLAGDMARRMMEEAYAAGRADERAETGAARAAARRSRGALRVIRAGG